MSGASGLPPDRPVDDPGGVGQRTASRSPAGDGADPAGTSISAGKGCCGTVASCVRGRGGVDDHARQRGGFGAGSAPGRACRPLGGEERPASTPVPGRLVSAGRGDDPRAALGPTAERGAPAGPRGQARGPASGTRVPGNRQGHQPAPAGRVRTGPRGRHRLLRVRPGRAVRGAVEDPPATTKVVSLVEGDYQHLGKTGTAALKVALRRFAARLDRRVRGQQRAREELPHRHPQGARGEDRHGLVAGRDAARPDGAGPPQRPDGPRRGPTIRLCRPADPTAKGSTC